MSSAILVVGGGFAGLTAALEAAELGHDVHIVEKTPFLGGRVAQLARYFPKLCPPSCGLEIQFQRVRGNPRVRVHTLAEVTALRGRKGAWRAEVTVRPRGTAPHAAELGLLASAMEGSVPSEFDFGLSSRKPLYRPVPFAYPARYVLDADAMTAADRALAASSRFLDLGERTRTFEIEAGAVVVATGWNPYDASRLTNLGAGAVRNCITNMQMERLASPFGPTGGRIVRPSDGRPPRRICFAQCAGSRDRNHLEHCSYVCCMATIKQCEYVRESLPGATCDVYYIDLRAPGRYVKVLDRVRASGMTNFVRGKVASVEQAEGDLVRVRVEDAVRGEKLTLDYDLVVLATGMRPSLADGCSLPVPLDGAGFVAGGEEAGIFAAGCAAMPLDVARTAQSGTAAALKAVQAAEGR